MKLVGGLVPHEEREASSPWTHLGEGGGVGVRVAKKLIQAAG